MARPPSSKVAPPAVERTQIGQSGPDTVRGFETGDYLVQDRRLPCSRQSLKRLKVFPPSAEPGAGGRAGCRQDSRRRRSLSLAYTHALFLTLALSLTYSLSHTHNHCRRFSTPNPEPVARYTRHPTLSTLHPTPHILHPAPYTLHPTPYTLHPAPFSLFFLWLQCFSMAPMSRAVQGWRGGFQGGTCPRSVTLSVGTPISPYAAVYRRAYGLSTSGEPQGVHCLSIHPLRDM